MSEQPARPGTLVMYNVPIFGVDGDRLKGFVWIKPVISCALSVNCYDPLTAEVPIKLGGGAWAQKGWRLCILNFTFSNLRQVGRLV